MEQDRKDREQGQAEEWVEAQAKAEEWAAAQARDEVWAGEAVLQQVPEDIAYVPNAAKRPPIRRERPVISSFAQNAAQP